MEMKKQMMVLGYKDLVLKVFMILVYIHSSRGTIRKRTYTLKVVGVNHSVAVSSCQPGHLLDLRPDFRNSIVNQLRPYYNSGELVNANLYWLGLSRDIPSDQFSWYDGQIQADMNMGDIPHILPGTAQDNENCVALKWSAAHQGFIIGIEACGSTWFPFCELKTDKPCDYTRLGDVYITPDGGYQVRDISGIEKRTLCEDECTNWSTINSDECWMFTYNVGSRVCRLITENVMPHWEETCHWFSSDVDWEAWNRNCLDVNVLDALGKEIILGPCPLIKQETTSTPFLLSTSSPEMTSEPLMSSYVRLYASSEVFDQAVSSVRPYDTADEALSTFPNDVITSSLENISPVPSVFQIFPSSSSTNHITAETIVSFPANLYGLNSHSQSYGQTEFHIGTTSQILFENTPVLSTEIQVTAIQTPVTDTVHSGFTPRTTPGTLSPTSDMSIPTMMEDDCPKLCPCNHTISGEAKAAFINAILTSLTVDKKNMSAYKRQYTSALDERPLSVGMGWIGVFLMVSVFGGIFVLDSKRLFTDTMMLFSNIHSLLKPKK